MKINNWNNLTPQQCIVREELATEIKAEKILGVVDYDYPTFHLTMHCILCTIVSGELKLLEHEDSKNFHFNKSTFIKLVSAKI